VTEDDSNDEKSVSCTHWSPSDHFPVFTRLSINPASLTPPTLHIENCRSHVLCFVVRVRICLNVVACRVRLQSVEFSAYRRSSPDRQVRQADECLRLQGTDVVVPRTLQRLFKASFFFFSGGGFSPPKLTIFPQTVAKLCGLYFSGTTNFEYIIETFF